MKIFVLLLFLAPLIANGEETNWKGVENALESYVKNPSSSNATIAANLLPSEHAPWGQYSPSSGASKIIYGNVSRFEVLERQVNVGHPESVRLAFKLFSISDGAFTEDLIILLGHLIRKNTSLFLEELQNNPLANDYYLGFLASNGENFIDRMEAGCLETKRKIAALKTVNEKHLRNIRDAIISVGNRYFDSEPCNQYK